MIFRAYKAKFADTAANAVSVAVIVLAVVFGALYLHGKTVGLAKIELKDVSAMRIPYDSVLLLRELAGAYGVDGSELLAVFCADNAFLPIRMAEHGAEELEGRYLQNYAALIGRYGKEKLEPYAGIFGTLTAEMQYFPVRDPNRGYMYGDSFGTVRMKGEDYGIDIIDRENIPGRLEVVNIAGGTVESSGFDKNDGYYVNITSSLGTVYYYSHLEPLDESLVAGRHIRAGETLGKMGRSGRAESASGYPVRLHLEIKIETDLAKDGLLINPYIFLRLAEDRIYITEQY